MKVLFIIISVVLLLACSTTKSIKQTPQTTTIFKNSNQHKENQANTTIYEEEPYVIRRAPLEYPRFAERNNIEGAVMLQVEVFADGTVGRVAVKNSVMSDPCVLSEAAVKSVKKWKFSPAKTGGKPVACWTTFPVVFELKKIR